MSRLPCRWYEAESSHDNMPLKSVKVAKLLDNWSIVRSIEQSDMHQMPTCPPFLSFFLSIDFNGVGANSF